ncbi:hypothetical protein ILUMI_21889 [Ignelater luminosus]|uniref:Phospholipase A(2) n=1 Tax=Ignelater luminosus TaxID=2038154 RepID=A0A8K0CFF8_IGNLU|nr:hypothetical protein ILUMI_21889 [Ignelater luminosus]
MKSERMDSRKPPEISEIPMSPSQGRATNSANVTVYLGYANNPFGPSIRFQHEKGKVNYSKNKVKKLQINKTQEDSMENFLDTGQAMVIQEGRTKRGVAHLYNMVSCATGCDPLIYKGYGCYCGFLGSGYAVDGIDR